MPRNELSRVVGISPPLDGVSARVVNHGTQLEVRNGGREALTVAGHLIAPGENVRFRDDRLAGDRWEIPIGASVVQGVVERYPPPPVWLWMGVVAVLAVAGAWVVRSRWGLVAGVGVVALAHVVHAVGSTLAVTGGAFLPLFLGASGVGVVCWPLAVVAGVAAARGKSAASFVAAVVGAMLVVAGIPDFDSFRFAQLPFAGPGVVDRVLVALTLGGGAGLAVGGFLRMRKELAR
ncbi:hypothetical protein [Saccharothrix variisporea]|uniref:hypothetical protein n=1 Tax=Saccharothrix variisporea TaxID=543527 RepID=UPI0011C36B83|nr:hypothetical protein [Saccharothrix variisporea]